MGLNEDDRIRRKNKLHQEAYDIYANLVNEGFSPEAIKNHCTELMELDPTNPRNDLYSTVLNIVGGSNEEVRVTSSIHRPHRGGSESD